jgi:membrane protease YdiL (CAAX protease family)
MGTLSAISPYLIGLCLISIVESCVYIFTGNIFTSISIHAIANAKVLEGDATIPLILGQLVVLYALTSFPPKIQQLLRTIHERSKAVETEST